MSVPPTQTAIITLATGALTITPTLPTPSPHAPGTVLVRTHALALNPADHKMPSRLQTPNLVAGSDFAGTIVAIGRDVPVLSSRPGCTPWAVGDRVCGAVHGCNTLRPRDGAFAQWVEADPVVLVRLPEGWGWEEGAALGGSCVGAVGLGLFWEMGLERIGEGGEVGREGGGGGGGGGGGMGHVVARGDKAELRLTVLVYGGSTACGTMALQILRLAGYIPIATCSPHNNALVTSYGAAATFDYRSTDCASAIKAHTKNSLRFAFDCIGTAQSTALCHEALGRSGGRYVALERYPEAAASGRKNVRGSWVLGPVMFGRPIDMHGYSRDANAGAREFGREWYACVERWAGEGKLRVHPARRVGEGGEWARAVLEGLEMLREGKVSGEKLIVEVGGKA